MLSLVQKGDGREFALYLRRAEGGWRKVSGLGDEVVAARFGLDGGLWLLSRKGAPRGRVLRVPLEAPDLARARVVAEATEGSIDTFEVTNSFTYGGRPSESLLPRWKRTNESKDATDRIEHQTTWTDPETGLKVVASVIAFKDFAAVDWLLRELAQQHP